MRRISAVTLLILAFSILFTTATHASEHLPLTTLVMRDRVITINFGSNGLLYTVSTQDGTVLDAQLSDAQLQAKYPEIYDDVRPAIADSNKTDGPIIMMWGETEHIPSDVLSK
ncbi:hypothetical protein [Mastigocladopsis repens]|uniref:hypothetical protein n=1 Tax=Mastigocladopsis repens TaxID=221287 RepID=UPI00037DEF53|nr:hypothetical protein [Mastigocladopsis repens]